MSAPDYLLLALVALAAFLALRFVRRGRKNLGCCGDCAAQWLVYLTSGGDVEREDSVGVIHWRQLAAMFGIPQFDYVFAGGLDARPDTAGDTLTAACTLAGALAKTL